MIPLPVAAGAEGAEAADSDVSRYIKAKDCFAGRGYGLPDAVRGGAVRREQQVVFAGSERLPA